MIFQIFYKEEQLNFTDRLFPLFNNVQNEKSQREYYYHFKEYGVFLNQYEDKIQFIKNLDEVFYGYLSWKFFQKNRLSVSDFSFFINRNPNYDVYFIDPFNQVTERFSNVWEAGEFYHPGLIEICKELFLECNLDIDLLFKPYLKKNMGFCNYWVGNVRFWNEYIKFSKPLYEKIHFHIKEGTDLGKRILIPADKEIDSNYISFILERIFSTFLEMEEFNSIRCRKISESEKSKLRNPIKKFFYKRLI